VLVSAVNSSKPYTQLPIQKQVAQVGLSTMDFPVWLLMKASLIPLVGPRINEQISSSPEIRERLREMLVTAFPMSLRTDGGVNDLTQIKNMPDFPLDQITTPALVIHGNADRIVPFEHGERSAENIPNAEFLLIPGGSHLCYLTHLEQTEPVMLEFLKGHASE
jgi:pimeloyl-ACP methyl ester carboxylesterase